MRLTLVQPPLRFEAATGSLPALRDYLTSASLTPEADDVVLLPEGVGGRCDSGRYRRQVGDLARALGCHVVGGSHLSARRRKGVNAGVVCDPSGAAIGRYEKLRPYAAERRHARPGSKLGEITVGGHRLLILICADFFFSDLIHLVTEPPDVILVAALSVTRKPTPHYARALWRHLAVARAYEFGAYVGISDWAHTAALPSSAGVSGFADPTASDAGGLFIPTGDAGVAVHSIDRSALEAFRGDRRARGFFWRGAEAGTSGDVVS